jgi:hypothetical protein
VKEAVVPVIWLPKLQIAITGSVSGDEKVRVWGEEIDPAKVMISPMLSGDDVTVPPTNEVGGFQTLELPLITRFDRTWPE